MHSILAARSDFSIGESILSVERLVDLAAEAGAKALGLADTMVITALPDFTTRCKKVGLKPVLGCRLRMVDDHLWRKPKKTEGSQKAPPEYFLNYYVLSEKGLKALYRLLSLANDADHFYINAKLSFADLFDALASLTSEDVAITSSDALSVLHHANARDILAKIRDALSASNVFVTLTPIDTPYFDTLNRKAIDLIRSDGFAPIVTRPCAYGKEQANAAEVMNALCSNVALEAIWHKSPAFRNLYPMTNEEWFGELKAAGTRLATQRGMKMLGAEFKIGLQNTDKLVDMVQYEWTKQAPSLPVMAPDEFAAVVEKCKAGWQKRFSTSSFGHRPGAQELQAVYMPRLKYELSVLKKLNFSGYFLLVEDIVSFAKSKGILVGPGRGSVGGSLVAYLMGITDCDPIRFGLLFERFINPDRIDLPDADLDFMSARRHEIVQYLIAKFGQKRVAGVSNFATLGPASAIRQVSKAFGLEEREYNCSKLTPKKHGAHIPLAESAEMVAEIGAFRDKYDGVWSVCLELEGVMRNLGQHAAGVVVGGCDLVERAVIERRKGDEHVTCWDKRQIEDQGLIKMDILGLETLDIIDLSQKYIRERHSKRVNLGAIPLDDPKVLEQFAQGKTVGIFQYDSGGMRKLLRDIGKGGAITFDDVTAASALYRPGPMESGMMDDYWKRKQGLAQIEYDHPLLEPILKETFGVIAYQEQVMQAARALAGYSAPDADKLRKIIGKKLPEEMRKERGKFVQGCIDTLACDEEWAGQVFDKIEGFAGYGFNKSHATTYALISYQAAYLKTYFPLEYLSATLTLVKDEKLPALLSDAATNYGITLDIPDVTLATDRFEILTDSKLMIPFQRIKGLSERAAKAIVEARRSGPFMDKVDFEARVNKRLVNSAKVAILDKIGAFARIDPAAAPVDSPTRIKDQRELIPGLITTVVPINREIQLDLLELRQLEKLHKEMHEAVKEDGVPVRPMVGKNAQFAVVVDAPSREEEAENMVFMSSPSRRPFWTERVAEAIHAAGMTVDQAYMTALLKRPKAGKSVSAEELKIYRPFFDQEIDLIKPPVIVLLGAAAVRNFLPDFKGKASEAAGEVFYDKGRDANLVIGFSPGEIWFDSNKQEALNKVFEVAAGLIS